MMVGRRLAFYAIVVSGTFPRGLTRLTKRSTRRGSRARLSTLAILLVQTQSLHRWGGHLSECLAAQLTELLTQGKALVSAISYVYRRAIRVKSKG